MTRRTENTLSVGRLSAGYGGRTVIDGFNLRAGHGEIIVLRGVNGSGKSTVLRCILKYLKPYSGEIEIGGIPLERLSRRKLASIAAYLPQNIDASCLEGITVLDAVLFGRFPHHGLFENPSAEDRRAAEDALASVGLSELAGADASKLSGGETRRMFIAACLAQGTRIIVMDEPFNQLDAETRESLAALIKEQASRGITFIVATHDTGPFRGAALNTVDIPPAHSGTSAAGAGKRRRRAGIVLSAAVTLMFAATIAAVLSPWQSLDPATAWEVFAKYRMPRLASAFLTGGILSAAGCLFQTIFRNPMASPYTLGTASGASFGAYAAVVFLPAAALWPSAFAGALLSILIVRICGGSGRSSRLLLGGIACGYIFSSATLLIQFLMTPWQTFSIARWTMGSVDVPDLPRTVMLLAAFSAALASTAFSRVLDAMMMGDEAAGAFGIDVKKWRLWLFVFAAMLTACAVAACGPVAFVGLVVPHAARILAGARHSRKLPACVFGGGLFLAACDTVPGALSGGIDIPVGIITAGIGAPVLIALLARQDARNHN